MVVVIEMVTVIYAWCDDGCDLFFVAIALVVVAAIVMVMVIGIGVVVIVIASGISGVKHIHCGRGSQNNLKVCITSYIYMQCLFPLPLPFPTHSPNISVWSICWAIP